MFLFVICITNLFISFPTLQKFLPVSYPTLRLIISIIFPNLVVFPSLSHHHLLSFSLLILFLSLRLNIIWLVISLSFFSGSCSSQPFYILYRCPIPHYSSPPHIAKLSLKIPLSPLPPNQLPILITPHPSPSPQTLQLSPPLTHSIPPPHSLFLPTTTPSLHLFHTTVQLGASTVKLMPLRLLLFSPASIHNQLPFTLTTSTPFAFYLPSPPHPHSKTTPPAPFTDGSLTFGAICPTNPSSPMFALIPLPFLCLLNSIV